MSAVTGAGVEDLPADVKEYASEYGEDRSSSYEDLPLNTEDFISSSFRSERCTVPQNIFKFDYSYGYDCKRYFNLVAPDENTLVFASGNLINFLDVPTKERTFRRSYLGGGIGHITTNPNPEYSHLTVAENGDSPPIIIYEWPSMEIFGVLKEGAAKRYAHINYSPDGELLASQSHDPDFLITVWKWKNWKQSPIILRTKAYVHDVYRVMFSPYVPGHLTTGGSGHIKFWKMSQTFTGLKLQGELGRFGKTEISDIVGIYPMPDEKVISGSEWGNLLVWEAGLIKVEVFRTKRRPCHSAPVMQLEYNRSKGEIWSVSQDGWLRAWEYRIIDEADPPDEDRVVQMVPSYERETKGVHLMSITKKKLNDPEDTFYYAQDGNGGIWLMDLILRADYEPSERLFRCHAGAVVDMAACPWGPYLISLGEDGRLQVYNYISRNLLHFHQFPAKGRALIWAPLSIDPSGSFLILGFDDGVVRVCVISLEDEKEITVITVQSTKPHNKPITVISMNKEGSLFVSAGEDKTVFLYQMENITGISLKPIGFVNVESTVTCFTWHTTISNVLLVGCQHGDLIQFEFPKETVDYTKTSYLLHTVKSINNKFKSCKAQIRRDLHLEEIERSKAAKIQKKMQEIADIKRNNPGLEIDEEAYLLDSESEEVLAPLEIPKIPNKIWFAMHTPDDTLWLSLGGYDAGYIYEYAVENPEIIKATVIDDGDDIEMHGFIYSNDKKYLITSMQNGAIRVNRVNPNNFHDLSDYWLLTMHDNFNGQITRMCFNFNNKYFFSCGTDGNIFSYQFNPEVEVPSVNVPSLVKTSAVAEIEIETDEGYASLSLEETMIKAENDKKLRLANEHKKKLRQRLAELTDRLSVILSRNCSIPKSQRYVLRHFIIDDRIMKAYDDMLQAKVELEKRKLAYDVAKSTVALQKMKKMYTDILDVFPIEVKAVNLDTLVRTIPQRSLGQKFYDVYREVEEKLLEESLKGRLPERGVIVAAEKPAPRKKQQELEPFLIGLSPSTIATKMGAKMNRSLRKYRERRAKIEKRQEEWNELNARKPVEGANHPDDVKTLENAKYTIGDFKLQSSEGYTVPEHLQESTLKKYQQLLEARIRSFDLLIHAFNAKVYRLRNRKVKMIQKMNELKIRLDKIHEELPTNRILKAPPIPEILPEDFPEKNLEVNLTLDKDALKHRKRQPKIEEKVQEDTSEENINFNLHELDEEKLALGIKGKLPDISGSCQNIVNYVLETTKQVDLSNIQEYIEEEKDTETDSSWETEMKARRLINKIYEQDILIAQMKQMVVDFDQEVQKVNEERFTVRRDATFMDLHLLVLNQELIIIKEFESVETDLRNIALSKLTEMLDMRDDMKRIELKIEEQYRYMEEGNHIVKELQQSFINSAKDNKFWDFLRRIFRKKYKPPKVFNPDDSQSSSISSESSSDSDDDDAASLDSREIGPIRLDESVCPKGCDKDLYENTFHLRTQRHNVEKQMKEEVKVTENLKRDLELAAKKMKTIEQACQKSKNDLEEYQRLKQKKLNEVMCTVVLRLNQIQHLGEDSKSTPGMAGVLVFNEPSLTRLYERVGELQTESLEERARHKKNKVHLHRMNIDCRHMQRTISDLHQEIADAMKLKFGMKVNLDDLEETILRRMVMKLRIDMLDVGSDYVKESKMLSELYTKKQAELKNTIKENTARVELLSVLKKEKLDLARLLTLQSQKMKKVDQKGDQYFTDDIAKLTAVAQTQLEQIQSLKSEIKMLTTKSLPLKPIVHEGNEIMEEANEVVIDDFDSLEEIYMGSELKTISYVEAKEEEDLEQQITEQDITGCIQDLIKEVVDEALAKKDSKEEIIIQVISDLIDQIPTKYLDNTDSLEFVANLIRDIAADIEINRSSIVEKVSEITGRKLENIQSITESILNKVFDTAAQDTDKD